MLVPPAVTTALSVRCRSWSPPDPSCPEPTVVGGARLDAGMTTAEYAVGTLAACGFAGVLFKVVTGPAVLQALTAIVIKALRSSF